MSKNAFNRSTTYRHCNRYTVKEPTIPTRKSECECKSDHDTDSVVDINTCTASAYQRATVGIPFALKPFSFIGPTKTICCSDPIIKKIRYERNCKDCKKRCNDCEDSCSDQICYYTIIQEICVEIPVHIGAKAIAGECWIDCHEAWEHDCED